MAQAIRPASWYQWGPALTPDTLSCRWAWPWRLPQSCPSTGSAYLEASNLVVQVGVAMASAAELSFNWMGFISAMISNLTFGFRAVLSKKCALHLSPTWFKACPKDYRVSP